MCSFPQPQARRLSSGILAVVLIAIVASSSGAVPWQPAAKPATKKLAPRRLFREAAASPGSRSIQVSNRAGLSKTLLDENQYTRLKGLGTEILQSWRPEKYFYVGVGRSPSAVISFLKVLVPRGAVSFPASGLRSGIAAANVAEFERHIEKLIPAEAFSEGRTILLMDTVSAGGSLRAMKGALEQYARARGKVVHVETLGLGSTAKGIDHTVKESGTFAGKDDIALYNGEHRIGTHTVEQLVAKRNPVHGLFVKALVQRIHADKSLDEFLAADLRTPVHLVPAKTLTWNVRQGAKPFLSETLETVKGRLASALMSSQFPEGTKQPIRISLSRAAGQGSSARWSVVSPLPESMHPALLAALEPLLSGGDALLPEGFELEIGPNRKGHVTGSESVKITRARQRIAFGKTKDRVQFPADSKSNRPPLDLATAQSSIAGHVAVGLENLDFVGGENQILTVELMNGVTDQWGRPLRMAVQTNLPESARGLLRSTPMVEAIQDLTRNQRGGLPWSAEISIKLDQHGRVSGTDAVRVTRKRVQFSMPARSRSVGFVRTQRKQSELKTREQALSGLREHLAFGLETLEMDDGAGKTLSVVVAPKVDHYGRYTMASETNIPEAFQSVIQSTAFGDLVDEFTRNEGGGLPWSAEISIKLDEQGRVSGTDAVSVTRKRVQFSMPARSRSVGFGRTQRKQSQLKTREQALSGLREHLAFGLETLEVDDGAGQTLSVVVAPKADHYYGRYTMNASETNIPPAFQSVIQSTAFGDLVDELTRNERGGLPWSAEISIKLDKHGRVSGTDAVRVTRKRVQFSMPARSSLVGFGRTQRKQSQLKTREQALSGLREHLAFGLETLEVDDGAGKTLSVVVAPRADYYGRYTMNASETNIPEAFQSAIQSSAFGDLVDDLTRNEGGGLPWSAEISIKLDEQGRVSGTDAVRVTRKRVQFSMPARSRSVGFVRTQRKQSELKTREQALSGLREHLALGLETLEVDDGAGKTLSVVVAPKADYYGRYTMNASETNIPEAFQSLIQSTAFGDLVDDFTRTEGGGLPWSAEISIKLDEHGRVSGTDAVSVTRKRLVLPLPASVRSQGISRDSRNPSNMTAAQAEADLRTHLASGLETLEVENGAGKTLIIEVAPKADQWGRHTMDSSATNIPAAYASVLTSVTFGKIVDGFTRNEGGGLRWSAKIAIKLDEHGRVRGPGAVTMTRKPSEAPAN